MSFRQYLGAVLVVSTMVACNTNDVTVHLPDDTPLKSAKELTVLGLGAVRDRFTAEVWANGNTAYTTTWGLRGITPGNVVKIWDVTGNAPVLVDSVIVSNAGTLGDVQTSDDGQLLAVAIEPRPNGGLALYSLQDPRRPQLITRYTSPNTQLGVHTAEIARVSGTLYAFCAIDPGNGVAAKLVILDISNPLTPVEVSILTLGAPYIHDVYVRDGMLFTAEWDNGLGIYDIGAVSGSPANPRKLGQALTRGGEVHNIWWYHDPETGSKHYLFVGQEGPGQVPQSSSGDVHVVDITNVASAEEVAVLNLPGAGTHNFTVDEANGLLYAAYYNGGIAVIDVRGDLGSCSASARLSDGRCDLGAMGRLKGKFSRPAAAIELPYIWGVHFTGNALYASDMMNGLWKISPFTR